jgi:anhydro-N-acetylmuramic acid kinase
LLRRALKEAEGLTGRDARPGVLQEAEQELTRWHAQVVQSFLKENSLTPSNIDIIGFHGQTVLHRPDRRLTVQLGLGQELANQLGIPVCFDMRADDVAAGGQGAPLVPIYHAALAPQRPCAFVNIGGVANVTFVGGDGVLLAFDTGPGNALINDWMMAHFARDFDAGGAVCLSGHISRPHVTSALAHEFFRQPPPKSLDRNTFAGLSLEGLSAEDGAATLAAFTVEAIAQSAAWFPEAPRQWVICGGGRHNMAIMRGLAARLPGVVAAEALDLNGDSMEAEAWAYLAVRSLKGLPLTFPGTTGARKPMTGGVLVRPS